MNSVKPVEKEKESFPPLGKVALPPKTTLNFKKVVMLPAAPAPVVSVTSVTVEKKKIDPEEYDSYDEDSEEEEYDEPITRRRGDKGIW